MALARALVPSLAAEDPGVAIAVTGSAARGDASRGSDLDLWCISPRHQAHHRVHGTFRGADVTLLCDGPASARATRTLLRCELADLLVLRDPRGDFAAVRALANKRRAATWRALCRNTSQDLLGELGEAARGPTWNRLSALREAALRLAAAWVYRRHGWRTPRWRTLRRVLTPKAVRGLEEVLALPGPAGARRALARVARRDLPVEVGARVRAGEWAEAVLLARRTLDRDVLTHTAPGPRWLGVSAATRRAIAALHGVRSSDRRGVAAEARSVARVARQLRVLPYFHPRVARALAALAREGP